MADRVRVYQDVQQPRERIPSLHLPPRIHAMLQEPTIIPVDRPSEDPGFPSPVGRASGGGNDYLRGDQRPPIPTILYQDVRDLERLQEQELEQHDFPSRPFTSMDRPGNDRTWSSCGTDRHANLQHRRQNRSMEDIAADPTLEIALARSRLRSIAPAKQIAENMPKPLRGRASTLDELNTLLDDAIRDSSPKPDISSADPLANLAPKVGFVLRRASTRQDRRRSQSRTRLSRKSSESVGPESSEETTRVHYDRDEVAQRLPQWESDRRNTVVRRDTLKHICPAAPRLKPTPEPSTELSPVKERAAIFETLTKKAQPTGHDSVCRHFAHEHEPSHDHTNHHPGPPRKEPKKVHRIKFGDRIEERPATPLIPLTLPTLLNQEKTPRPSSALQNRQEVHLPVESIATESVPDDVFIEAADGTKNFIQGETARPPIVLQEKQKVQHPLEPVAIQLVPDSVSKEETQLPVEPIATESVPDNVFEGAARGTKSFALGSTARAPPALEERQEVQHPVEPIATGSLRDDVFREAASGKKSSRSWPFGWAFFNKGVSAPPQETAPTAAKIESKDEHYPATRPSLVRSKVREILQAVEEKDDAEQQRRAAERARLTRRNTRAQPPSRRQTVIKRADAPQEGSVGPVSIESSEQGESQSLRSALASDEKSIPSLRRVETKQEITAEPFPIKSPKEQKSQGSGPASTNNEEPITPLQPLETMEKVTAEPLAVETPEEERIYDVKPAVALNEKPRTPLLRCMSEKQALAPPVCAESGSESAPSPQRSLPQTPVRGRPCQAHCPRSGQKYAVQQRFNLSPSRGNSQRRQGVTVEVEIRDSPEREARERGDKIVVVKANVASDMEDEGRCRW